MKNTTPITITPHFITLPCDSETPVSLFEKLAGKENYSFLLESAENSLSIERYSIIGFGPKLLFTFPAGASTNPLETLAKAYSRIRYKKNSSLPRLQAPFVGYFSYEVARHFEKLTLPLSGSQIPEGIFFFPNNLIIFDHVSRSVTLIAYNKKDLELLQQRYRNVSMQQNPHPIDLKNNIKNSVENSIAHKKEQTPFAEMVSAAKEKICAGELFQIVLCQTFEQTTSAHPLELYRRLRLISPSPYMYYLHYPDFSVIGSSPETLVRTEDNEIIIRPIAGTRRRGKTPAEDKKMENELRSDLKEQAEHMMLVDLGRNDMGRMAKPGSVKVTRLMQLEKYSHVMHLVSEVRGTKKPGSSLFDIFKMSFPAGTLSGAPKIRAMEVIAQLEKRPRDIYGGAVGYFDLSGTMDFAIAIRTMIYRNGAVTLKAGAGIVYDSLPAHEHLECCNKARGPLTAV